MAVSAIDVKANDILTLKNGMKFAGKVKKIKNCSVIFKVESQKYAIPVDSIYSVEFENPENRVLKKYLELDHAEKCMLGTMDADNFHGKVGFHFVMGVLFGPFAIIGAAVANPSPQNGRDTYMMSQNQKLFSDPIYIKCYRKKAVGKNMGNSAIGWGAWILLVLLMSS